MVLLPSPDATLAGCVWLPRILAKARLVAAGKLPEDYAVRFGHPDGVDGQFLFFFGIGKDDIVAVGSQDDQEVAAWFTGLESVTEKRIAEWNHLALNPGCPGFPMADRLSMASATSYSHLAGRGLATVFEVLEADEE